MSKSFVSKRVLRQFVTKCDTGDNLLEKFDRAIDFQLIHQRGRQVDLGGHAVGV